MRIDSHNFRIKSAFVKLVCELHVILCIENYQIKNFVLDKLLDYFFSWRLVIQLKILLSSACVLRSALIVEMESKEYSLYE